MAFEDVLMSRPVSVVVPVVSSLAGALRRYVMSVLPTEFVKDFFIDTEIPMHRIMGRRRFRPMSRSQLSVRQLPLLTVKIETTADQSDFATGTTFWTSTRFLRDPTQLTRLIADDQNLRYAGYETERMVVRFGVSFTVETDLRASELMMYLRRSLPVGQRFYLNDIDITTEIPRDILRAIWSDMGLGDGTDPDEVSEFRDYLRRVTVGNVEQVVNSASGRLTYAFSYRANPLVNITGVPSMSVNREGNVVRNAQVDIPFEMDVEVPVAYAYRQEEALYNSDPYDANPFIGEEGGQAYFSAAFRQRLPENIEGELQLVFFTSVVTGDTDVMSPLAPDVTDLSASVDTRIKTLVDKLLDIDATKVRALLWLDGNTVPEDGWRLDLSNWSLSIDKPVLQPRQKYHFGVYADVSDIDKLAPRERRPQAGSPMFRT